MWSENISNVTNIKINKLDIDRVWFNGEIVWQNPKYSKYFIIDKTEITLNKENNYTDVINITSNTNWSFEYTNK